MAKAKNERNQEFITAWKQKGLSNQELQEKFNLSPGGVKALKQRLRTKDSSLYADKRPELTKIEREVARDSDGFIKFAGEPSRKVTSTTTQTSPSTKRMTFWLEENMIEKIKRMAAKQRRTASSILRDFLEKL